MKIKSQNPSFIIKLVQSLLIVATVATTYADDTEVFFTDSAINSNVLFIMDNSGSMTADVPGTSLDADTVLTIKKSVGEARENTGVENRRGGGPYTTWGDLPVDSWWNTGIRFTDVKIPRGAIIKTATLRLRQSQTEASISPRPWAPAVSKPLRISVNVEDSANSHEFDGGHKIIRRALNHNKVIWDVPITHNKYVRADTPEIKTLVQAITDKGGWTKGGAITFILKRHNGPGLRYFYSNEGDSEELYPELVVEFTAEGADKTRMQVMQGALKTVLADAPSNLNVGIMNYGDSVGWRRGRPNGIRFPVKGIDVPAYPILEESVKVGGAPDWNLSNIPQPSDNVMTVRHYLSELADSWAPRGMTPIVDALYEAALYYRGDQLEFGYGAASAAYSAHPSTYAKPAPDLVEPVMQTKIYDLCGSVINTTIYDYYWNMRLTRWRAGDTDTVKCPADVNNPSVATSSTANCAATEHSCGESRPYRRCLNWISELSHQECTGTDEDGNPTGCHKVIDRRGRCDRYGGNVTTKWCKYKICGLGIVDVEAPEYITPAVAECQSNNIILMSDGKPEYLSNRRPRAYDDIKSMMGGAGCQGQPFTFKAGECGSELTHFLADGENNDMNPGIAGNQFVNTFVIGFASGITENAEDYLTSLVTVEDDPNTANREGYFSAQNEAELASAFAETLESIAQEAKSQASPGYSVNVKSGLEHENDIYIPVFNKNGGATWSGNLKKFKLADEAGHRVIKGKSSPHVSPDLTGYRPAMTELGLFRDDAWDEWSDSTVADGQNVRKGGVAGKLTDPNARNLYTNVDGRDLSSSDNRLTITNSNITKDMLWDNAELGLDATDASKYRDELINFISGWSEGKFDDSKPVGEKGVARTHMGDMLHSEPVVITYPSVGGHKSQYVFAATNEGYLHAFDTTTGEEKWAFMPKALLENIEGQFKNEGKHIYGIDGNISYWHDDTNHNGVVDGGEKITLIFGMRRGGRAYYALDITNINSPKLKWKIDHTDAGFSRLGQTWSMAYFAKVMKGGNKTPVVVFTGGNDENSDFGSGDSYDADAVSTTPRSHVGDDIYIVDAQDGSLLWNMRDAIGGQVHHAIPGGARILDVDRNGLLDRLYFADLGGNVWRLDLDETLGTGSTLVKFAKLGGGGDNARKFYNEPDVATLQDNGKLIFSVSIGSGLRPHPLNEKINDHMFVLLDKNPYGVAGSHIIKMRGDDSNDLARVTVRGNASKTLSQDKGFDGKEITQLPSLYGWFVDFPEDGEKVLASSITFEGSIIFTTLVPEALDVGVGISACAAPATQGRVYAMSLLTGEASMDLDLSGGEPTDDDVFSTISANEIPGTPQGVFNKLQNCHDGDCEHNVDIRVGKKSTEIGKHDVQRLESVYWSAPSN